jgi:hypothetical protein
MDDACLTLVLERLRRIESLEKWSALDGNLIEVHAEAGFCMYEDQNGLVWNVFGLMGQVERIQVDLVTEVHPSWSAYENDQALDEWIDKFYRTHDRLRELLEQPADFVGYFEDAGFPDEHGALYLAQWLRDPAPKLMLSYSGQAPFDRRKKQSRLSLTLAYGPLSIERLRRYRTYLLFPDKPPESG